MQPELIILNTNNEHKEVWQKLPLKRKTFFSQLQKYLTQSETYIRMSYYKIYEHVKIEITKTDHKCFLKTDRL